MSSTSAIYALDTLSEKCEDIKEAIRRNNRRMTDKTMAKKIKKKKKRTKGQNLQNTTQKDQSTLIPLKQGVNSGAP